MDKFAEIRVPVAHNNPSIKRKENKCVLCGKCKDVCKKQVGVAGYWQYDSEDIVCINCGQCVNFCPVDALIEKDDNEKLQSLLKNPNKKVAFVVAPAVRVSLGEMFGMQAGEFVAGKMVTALKNLGADYVFDVCCGADITVMEEAVEFIERLTTNSNLPHFTSCCPAWVKFVKTFYPQYLPNLSTCKSPIAMLSSTIKNWFAKTQNLNAENLAVVAVTPCVAKKMEAELLCLRGEYGKDTDWVITVRELARLLKNQNVDFCNLVETEFDKPFDLSSGAGTIFGVSGGVCQAVMRTAYYLTTGKNPPQDFVKFTPLDGIDSAKVAQIKLIGRQVNLCVVSGCANVRKILDKLTSFNFDFIEIMACPNGCVGGGGQPKSADMDLLQTRGESLVNIDGNTNLHCSHQNPRIEQTYSEFYGKPNSETAQQYLHINHCAR